MNESFKTDPSLATSARAAKESGSYLCASNVTPTAVRFIVSVFLCLLCSCRMSSTQMTCSHFRKNRPKKRQKPSGCRSRIISKNRPVPIFGRSTGASLVKGKGKYLTYDGKTSQTEDEESPGAYEYRHSDDQDETCTNMHRCLETIRRRAWETGMLFKSHFN